MHASKFVRDSIGFAVSQYLVRFLLMVRGLVAARLLGPSGYGAWNAIMLILDYGVFAPLGTIHGLDQTVPARIVDGDSRRLERIKRAGLFNIALFTALFALACVVFLVTSRGRLNAYWGLGGALVVALCLLATNLGYYLLTLLRSHGNIGTVSAWYVVQAVGGAIGGLALIPWLGAWGLLWGWCGGSLAALVLAVRRSRAVAPLAPAPSGESLGLLRVGFPLYLYSASNLVMRSLDRLIVLRFLGTEALGLYSLAVIALTFLLYLPDSIAYVLYPRLVARFRAAGDDPAALAEPVRRTALAIALIMPALCALAYLAANDVVRWVLPRFLDGVPPLRILCFSAAGLALASLGSITLMALGRQRVLVQASLAMAALGGVLDLIAVATGHGIRGVAWATFVTYCANSALLICLAVSPFQRGLRAQGGFLVRLFLPLLLAVPLAWSLERFMPWSMVPGPMQVVRLVTAAILFLGLYALLARPFARGTSLRRLLGEIEWPWNALLRRGGPPA